MTVSRKAQSLSQLYEADYLRWLDGTVACLREGAYDALDRDHLIEELAAMGRSERRAIRSNTQRLLQHLLKWVYQPERRAESWVGTIVGRRRQILNAFEDSPSLRQDYEREFAQNYQRVRQDAASEARLPLATFPEQCPFDPWQILDPAWWPQE